VLAPHRAGAARPVDAQRLETDTAIGVRLTRAGQTATIGFRKAGIAGPASLAGKSFDAPVLVETWR
jgi:hypothetical protein